MITPESITWPEDTPDHEGEVGTDATGARFLVMRQLCNSTDNSVALLSACGGYPPGTLIHYSRLKAPITWGGLDVPL